MSELFGPEHEAEESELFGRQHERDECRCVRHDQFSLTVDSRNCPVHRQARSSSAKGDES